MEDYLWQHSLTCTRKVTLDTGDGRLEKLQAANDWIRVYPLMIIQQIEGFAPHELKNAGPKQVLFSKSKPDEVNLWTDKLFKVNLKDIEAVCNYEDVSTYYFFYSPSTGFIKVVWTVYDPEQDKYVYDEDEDVVGYIFVLGE
jgi:hypothetical protein